MTDIVADPDHLRTLADDMERQAENIKARREELFEQMIECQRDATDMRHRADMIERTVDRRVVVRMRHPRQVTPRELDRIAEAVKRLEPTTTAAIATEEAITENQARDRLKRLEKDQRIVRRGAGSSIRWHSPEYEAVPLNAQSYSEWVRDVMFELGTGTIDDVVATGWFTRATATRWLRYWEDRGTFESETIDGQLVFAVKEHAAEPVNREKRTTPEQDLVGAVVRGREVGSGRGLNAGNADVTQFLAELQRRGLTVEKGGTNHFKVYDGGKYVAGVASTPSDTNWKRQVERQLRRAGVSA